MKVPFNTTVVILVSEDGKEYMRLCETVCYQKDNPVTKYTEAENKILLMKSKYPELHFKIEIEKRASYCDMFR